MYEFDFEKYCVQTIYRFGIFYTNWTLRKNVKIWTHSSFIYSLYITVSRIVYEKDFVDRWIWIFFPIVFLCVQKRNKSWKTNFQSKIILEIKIIYLFLLILNWVHKCPICYRLLFTLICYCILNVYKIFYYSIQIYYFINAKLNIWNLWKDKNPKFHQLC